MIRSGGASPTLPGILIGVNALGRLLMELRKKIKDGTLHPGSVIQPIDILGFLLFNHPSNRYIITCTT